MTIQKKSLISTLNTTKKAIVASSPATGVSTGEVRSSARRYACRRTSTRDSSYVAAVLAHAKLVVAAVRSTREARTWQPY